MPNSRNIYLVTHPEATHHVERVVGGWHDSVLTPAGLRAAAAIAESLRARIPADAPAEVFASDLRRTSATAEFIGAALGVEPVLDARLREKSYGEAEGRPQAWLDQRFVPPPAAGDRLEHDEGIPGAETRGALARRVYPAMADIVASPCPHQVVVTHGFTATMAIAWWIGMPLDALGHVSFGVTPGSISTLREDDFFHNRQLAQLADDSHLPS